MTVEAAPRELRRRLSRPWRIAFIIYALAMTTGTHWPELEFGDQVPASDKFIHLTAFAGLTWLLWRTRWIGPRWLVAAIVVAWALIDELTQAIPGLNRHISSDDFLASMMGVLVVAAWLWALKPVGGRINRMRLALHTFAFQRVFIAPRNWLVFIGLLLACSLPAAILWPIASPPITARAIIVAAIVFAFVGVGILFRLFKQQRAVVAYEQRCLACDATCVDVRFDEAGRAPCPACGSRLHAAQWGDPPPPGSSAQLGLLLWPVAASALVIIAGFLALMTSAYLYSLTIEADPTAGAAPRIARFIGQLPPALTRTVDLALLLLLFAIATRVYRARLGRFFDRSIRCRKCGHDLRGTPTERGMGRCGECGAGFVRMEMGEEKGTVGGRD